MNITNPPSLGKQSNCQPIKTKQLKPYYNKKNFSTQSLISMNNSDSISFRMKKQDFLQGCKKTLRAEILKEFDDTIPAGKFTGWIKILSKSNDTNNFEKNVSKLQILSNSNCANSD